MFSPHFLWMEPPSTNFWDSSRSKNKLKKAALNIIAGQMSESEITAPRLGTMETADVRRPPCETGWFLSRGASPMKSLMEVDDMFSKCGPGPSK